MMGVEVPANRARQHLKPRLARSQPLQIPPTQIARAKGFLMVSASPLTRSSHHAGEDFARLQAARRAKEAVA